MTEIKAGDAAPDFSLKTEAGETVTLSQFRGKPVVLFFYPKADTFGCTKEACAFRDSYQDFVDAGAVVIGISSDSVDAQNKFKSKHRLQYPLLADEGGKTRKEFGVPSSMFGMIPGRVTYLINAEGKVAYVFNSQMSFSDHVSKTLEEIKKIRSQSS
eukprot:ANDGO_05098.mRNA.1 Peroxiredoxin Q